MAGEKKKLNWSENAQKLGYILIVVTLVFFGWLKITDKCLFMFGTIVNPYTFAFIAAFIVLLINTVNGVKKNDGNFNFISVIMTISLSVVFICTINSVAGDVKNSKVKDVLHITQETSEGNAVSVVLCEVTKFNSVVNGNSTYIDIYRVSGGIAKKIGVIDELYFSVECVKSSMYTYYVSADKSKITIECTYGEFGDGIVMMNPAYMTGRIRYVFKLN